MSHDLIDQLLSITDGSHLDQLRRHRQVARDNIQKAYDALFSPRDASQVSLPERFAIAAFVAGLQGQTALANHYDQQLSQAENGAELATVIAAEVERGATAGPYGDYPAGPLSAENKPGLHYTASPSARAALGDKLAAALEHAHLLVFRPRDSSRRALEVLTAAGWSTAGIVTISQLVAYLTFQTRIIEGLSALAAAQPRTSQVLPKVATASAIA